MRASLIALWLLLPILVGAYHFGPGQQRLQLDAAAATLNQANQAVNEQRWSEAFQHYSAALAQLPKNRADQAFRIRLEMAKAQMMAQQLPEARLALDELLLELETQHDAIPGIGPRGPRDAGQCPISHDLVAAIGREAVRGMGARSGSGPTALSLAGRNVTGRARRAVDRAIPARPGSHDSTRPDGPEGVAGIADPQPVSGLLQRTVQEAGQKKEPETQPEKGRRGRAWPAPRWLRLVAARQRTGSRRPRGNLRGLTRSPPDRREGQADLGHGFVPSRIFLHLSRETLA